MALLAAPYSLGEAPQPTRRIASLHYFVSSPPSSSSASSVFPSFSSLAAPTDAPTTSISSPSPLPCVEDPTRSSSVEPFLVSSSRCLVLTEPHTAPFKRFSTLFPPSATVTPPHNSFSPSVSSSPLAYDRPHNSHPVHHFSLVEPNLRSSPSPPHPSVVSQSQTIRPPPLPPSTFCESHPLSPFCILSTASHCCTSSELWKTNRSAVEERECFSCCKKRMEDEGVGKNDSQESEVEAEVKSNRRREEKQVEEEHKKGDSTIKRDARKNSETGGDRLETHQGREKTAEVGIGRKTLGSYKSPRGLEIGKGENEGERKTEKVNENAQKKILETETRDLIDATPASPRKCELSSSLLQILSTAQWTPKCSAVMQHAPSTPASSQFAFSASSSCSPFSTSASGNRFFVLSTSSSSTNLFLSSPSSTSSSSLRCSLSFASSCRLSLSSSISSFPPFASSLPSSVPSSCPSIGLLLSPKASATSSCSLSGSPLYLTSPVSNTLFAHSMASANSNCLAAKEIYQIPSNAYDVLGLSSEPKYLQEESTDNCQHDRLIYRKTANRKGSDKVEEEKNENYEDKQKKKNQTIERDNEAFAFRTYSTATTTATCGCTTSRHGNTVRDCNCLSDLTSDCNHSGNSNEHATCNAATTAATGIKNYENNATNDSVNRSPRRSSTMNSSSTSVNYQSTESSSSISVPDRGSRVSGRSTSPSRTLSVADGSEQPTPFFPISPSALVSNYQHALRNFNSNPPFSVFSATRPPLMDRR